MKNMRLGVNIDHVATLRNARGEAYPDPVRAAEVAVAAGADQITCHPRLDQRHIRFSDLPGLRAVSPVMNLEMAAVDQMFEQALDIGPDWACIVPERREELTTEGGLDVRLAQLPRMITALRAEGIKVSLFVDPDEAVVRASAALGADAVELHTGAYGKARGDAVVYELERIERATAAGVEAAIAVHAGHGLTLDNTTAVAAIAAIQELNIGHALVADALFLGGLGAAVRAYKDCIAAARKA
ncbi:MAG: pyridoxine 5'-phosphate synthase [Myxococcota bacterium]|nr:pyridoxine 5'-phosphate synthase [Myxococcota bacterium]